MISHGETRRREVFLAAAASLIVLAAYGLVHARPDDKALLPTGPRSLAIKAGEQEALSIGGLKASQTYTLTVVIESGRLQPEDRLKVTLLGRSSMRATPTSTSLTGRHATARLRWYSRGKRATAIRP
jgi:hypothetical protein